MVLLPRQDHLADTIRLKRELRAAIAERTAFLSKSLALETLVYEQWEKQQSSRREVRHRRAAIASAF